MNAKFYVLLTILARVGGAGLAACSAILLAQVLGKEGIGLFALLRALPAVLVMLTELGISAASPYLINKRRFLPHEVLGNAVLVGLLIGACQVLLWIASHQLIADYVLRNLPLIWVLAAALIAPLEVQLIEVQSILRSLQHFWSANLMRIGQEAAILASLVTAALLNELDIEALVPCLLLAQFAVLVFGVARLATIRLWPTSKINLGLLRESVRFGIRAQLGAALQYLNFRLDHLILGVLTGPEVVGVYFVATRAAELFRFLPTSVGFVLAPRLAGRTYAAAMKTVQRYALTLFLLNLSIMGFAAIAGPYLFPILFDDWSIEAIVPFWILLVGLTAMGANGAFSSFNAGQGLPQYSAYSSGIGLVVTVALDLALIPFYGPIGAAIASSAAYAVAAGTLAALFWRTVRSGVEPSLSRST